MAAKRSDFAQKLLDDLRLRKERMAASQSQTSNRSNSMATDAYTYSKQTQRRSREMRTSGTTGPRTRNMHNQYAGGNILMLTNEEASNQIVPFGRGHNTEKMGDLSMALQLALENGGKLRRMDSSSNVSVLSFLQQIGRRSVDYGKMERKNRVESHQPSTSHFPILSHQHINEISKGAQKLNQILKTCSHGLNFDIYSVAIGKELLKGAIDLEESLRMLADLQDASQKMVSTQQQNRITLIEDDEDNGNIAVVTTAQKVLNRPRFSFDKSLKTAQNTQEVATTKVKQKLPAQTFSSEATGFDRGNRSLVALNSVSRMQSVSYDLNVKMLAASSGQKNQSSSSQQKEEKGRIPNVIAKLMGLEKLPENGGLEYRQRSSGGKHKVEEVVLKKTAQESNGTGEQKTTDTYSNSMAYNVKNQKLTQAKKIPTVHNIMLQTEKYHMTCNDSFDVEDHNGQSRRKGMEGVKLLTSPSMPMSKTKKEESTITQFNQHTGSRKDNHDKEKKWDNKKRMEERGAEYGETKKWNLRDERQRVIVTPPRHERREAAHILQEKQGRENKTASKLLPRNQQKSYVERKFHPHVSSGQERDKEQQSAKQKLKVRKQKGAEAISRTHVRPVRYEVYLGVKQPHISQSISGKEATREIPFQGPNTRHRENLLKEKQSTASLVKAENPNNTDTRQISSIIEDSEGNPTFTEENLVNVPVVPKGNGIKAQKSDIEEVTIRITGTLRCSVLEEMKLIKNNKLSSSEEAQQVSASRLNEAEESTTTRKSEANIRELSLPQESQKEAKWTSNLHCHAEDECNQVEDILEIQSPTPKSPNAYFNITDEQQSHTPDLCKYNELIPPQFVEDPQNGPDEGVRDSSYTLQLKKTQVLKSEMQPLTESEDHLKQILMKSQLFLNAAEEVLKLNIPYEILHESGSDCQDDNSKLLLDCGYEVMKRQGRRQEIILRPCVKLSFIPMNVSSLDDLVMQLQRSFEKLKSYGHTEYDVVDSIPKMLNNDVVKGDPIINCMWDMGWSEQMFAYVEIDDITRDVEKYLLNGLLDEITIDILHV